MKEATGEVSGTVITIVLVGLVLGVGVLLFGGGKNSMGYKWITGLFGQNVCQDGQKFNTETGVCE